MAPTRASKMTTERLARWLLPAAIMLLALSLANEAVAQSMAPFVSAWPMDRGGPQRTGRSMFLGPRNNNTKWVMHLQSRVSSSPIVGPDGHVYFLTEDGYLFAVDAEGNEQWHRKITTYAPFNTPAVDANGTVYVTTLEGVVHALFSNGTDRWTLTVPWRVPIGPAPTVFNNSVYITTENGVLYCISFEDELGLEPVFLWNFTAQYRIATSPAISPSGVVYVASDDGNVYAVAPGGSIDWKFRTSRYMRSGLAVSDDGTVYVGDSAGYIYALYPDGSLKWLFRTEGKLDSSPAVDTEGNVYVGSQDSYLYAFDNEGTLKWKFKTGGAITSSPCVDPRGVIYFGSEDGYLYALLPSGELSWRYRTRAPIRSSPAIGSDSTLYFGSDDYAFRALLSKYSLEVRLEGLPAGLQVDLRLNEVQAGQLEPGKTLTFELFGEEPVHLQVVQDSIDIGSGSHYACSNASLVVNPDVGAVVFRYRAEHYVTAECDYCNVTGGGWYDEGSLAHINTPETIYYSNRSRIRFEHWSGDSQSSNSSVSVLVNGPKKLRANYVEEHIVEFDSHEILNPNATLPVIMHMENEEGQRTVISNRSIWLETGRYLIWVDSVIDLGNQTQMKFVKWVGNVSSPGSGIQLELTGPANFELLWTRLYLVTFAFVDSEARLSVNPSSVMIEGPDGERVELMDRQAWLLSGTWKFVQILYGGVDVKEYPPTFNVESPRVVTVVCRVHHVLLSVVDFAGLPALGNTVTVTLTNGTELTRLVGQDGKIDLGQVPEIEIFVATSFLFFTSDSDIFVDSSEVVVNAPLSIYSLALILSIPSAIILLVLVWRRMSRRPPVMRKIAPIE